MKIEVTQEHIDSGNRGSCLSCPIALAIMQATGEPRVDVGFNSARIGDMVYRLPLTAQGFIGRFDSNHPCRVEPFTFHISNPCNFRSPYSGSA